MKGRLAVALSAVLVAACAEPTSIPTSATPLEPSDEAPVFARGQGGPIPGQYIVVFKDDRLTHIEGDVVPGKEGQASSPDATATAK